MQKSLYIDYTQSSSGGDPVDNGRWSDLTDEQITLKINGIYRDKGDKFFVDSINVKSKVYESEKEVCLVTARYYDGGSFGRTYGNFEFKGIFKSIGQAKAFSESFNEEELYTGWFEGFEGWQFDSFIIGDRIP